MGDTKSVNRASKLAVECKTDEALAALDTAEAGGGLGTYLAELERVGILRDVGRTAEAEQALQVYMSRPETADSDVQEVEESIEAFIEKLRDKRLDETGSATCP
jgi:hypothetical protein